MGDGALVYFGFPRAHEDDAERAVRAGLDLVEAVGALRSDRGRELEGARRHRDRHCRGRRSGGQGAAQEQAVVGETPNLAARLQALAEPGNVVIAEATRRLLGGAFELKALGPQTLKGFDAPGSRLGGFARGRERQPLRGVAFANGDAFRRARA